MSRDVLWMMRTSLLMTTCRTRTVSPLTAPDTPLDISVHFDKGIPVKVVTPTQTATESLELFTLLNALGKEHGVGRIVSSPGVTSSERY